MNNERIKKSNKYFYEVIENLDSEQIYYITKKLVTYLRSRSYKIDIFDAESKYNPTDIMNKKNEKKVLIGKYNTLKECLKEYDKLMDEGRNVFWGQFPEGHYEITEYIPID